MEIFMERLSEQYSDYRLILVMDQAAWHRTSNLKKFENIRIIYLPPYSPEVNPAEHLWEHIREKYLRNGSWLSMDALADVLENALVLVERSKQIIQALVGFHWTLV
jgi:transposase